MAKKIQNNLFVQYVEKSKSSIYEYLKLIFKKRYNSEIATAYVETYIRSRYYNLSYKENSRAFYLKIKEALTKKSDELLKDNKRLGKEKKDPIKYKQREETIKQMLTTFDYIFFFDKVRNAENIKKLGNIEKVIDNLYNVREKEFQITEKESTKKEFTKLVKENMKQADELLDMYFIDNSFELEINKLNQKSNLYTVELISNIEMPMLYSSKAIDIAYNSQNIREQRLQVEYILLSLLITRDIVEANFKDEYLVELTPSIISKKQKLAHTLEYINDAAIQDKINLKIKYEDFLKNKQKVFDLIKEGYKFALIIDDKLENTKELAKLQMFSYIIVNKNLEIYKQISKDYKKSDQIIFE